MREFRHSVRVTAPLVFVLLLASCVTPPQRPPSPPSAEQLSISIREIPADQPVSQLHDLYVQIKAVPTNADTTFTFQRKSNGALLKEKLLKYVWDDQETLGVTLNGAIDGQSFGKRAVILTDLKPSQNSAYGDDQLTPLFRASSTLMLQWETSRAKSVKTQAISVAGDALMAVSAIYAPNGVIFQTIKNTSEFDKKIADADKKLGNVFSDGATITSQKKAIDLSAIKGYEIRINNDAPVIRVNFEFHESVLSPNGKVALIPQRPAEIKSIPIAGKKLVQTLIQGDDGQSELIKLINRDTADDYARFCEDASVTLASKGYNYIDRAVILYAYLKDSNWNNKRALRNDSDYCFSLVSEGLASIGNPNMQLASAQDLSMAAVTNREVVVKTLDNRKTGFWNRLSPRLSAPTDEYLDSVAQQNISLLSVKHDFQLTENILLKAGIPRTFSVAELAPILRDAKLTYDKEKTIKNGIIEDACYSISNLPNSSFRAYCFYPQASTRPITMEFNFDADFASDKDSPDPKLTMLKFFPAAPLPTIAAGGNADMASR